MSLNNINPSAMFGGSWQELTGSYIKLGGDGTIAHNCKTSCHVTVSNDGQNPCPTNCNYYVSNSDIYTTRLCYTAYNNDSGVDCKGVNGNPCRWLVDGCSGCDNDTIHYSCWQCYGSCVSNHNCGNSVGGTYLGISGGISNGYEYEYRICDGGCVGCVNCNTNTYYTCNSCNSACHSCNSHCANCYSNCHSSVGENFNIMYVHMWKRVG